MAVQKIKKESATQKSNFLGGGTLTPYSGKWEREEASHLLRRVSFGPTYDEIKTSIGAGLDKTIEALFRPLADPALPINFSFADDPAVPIGETWVDKPADASINGLTTARNISFSAWQAGLMLEGPLHVKEKLILFWHNHLVISDNTNGQVKYDYYQLLRKFALGDFKQLMKDMTIDGGMLFYLNGAQNTNVAPNENYSRELLELFTIGKGPLVGPGDYTNYTEEDVVELARALTGWQYNRRTQTIVFNPRRHDTGTKTLSARFNNAEIGDLGDKEYERVIDIIFEQEEVSRFLSRQLYIWYVNSNITNAINADVIEPMAQILRDSNYIVEPALKALLSSEHFFEECNRGAIIKSPIDFTLGLMRTGQFGTSNDILVKYRLWSQYYRGTLRVMEQAPFIVPSVAGWQAYYQEPVYYRYWLSAVSLPLRKTFVDTMITGRFRGNPTDSGLKFLEIIAQFDAPEEPDEMLKDLSYLFLTYPLSTEQYEYLKTEVLIPGLPDNVWTQEYNEYRADPTNNALRTVVLGKLQKVMSIILNMPEHQLT